MMLLHLCFFLLLVHFSQTARIDVDPSEFPPTLEEDSVTLTLWLRVNASDTSDSPWYHGANVKVACENKQVQVDYYNFTLLPNGNTSITITVERFGYDRLHFAVTPLDENVLLPHSKDVLGGTNATSQDLSFSMRLRLLRRENALDIIFLICISIFIIINNVNMGCILDLQVLKSVLKKPVGPIVGFCSQFLFMPLASYGVGLGLLESRSFRLGLFTLGCCPGGTGSNFWTFLFRGDVNLSVVMTFVSTVAALGMMPLWLFTLGQEFFREEDGGELSVPYDQLLITLVSFAVPVGIGTLIRYCRPNWAKKSEKIIRPYTILLLVFFLTIGIYTNWYIIRLWTWQIVVAGIIVAWGGYVFGAVAALCFCMNKEQVIAISIETALQNPGVAFILLKISLPQPEADFASVSPVAQLMVTGIPLWVFYIIYCIKRRKQTKAEQVFKLKAMAGQERIIDRTPSWKKWLLGKKDFQPVHVNNDPSGPLQPKSLVPKTPVDLTSNLWISTPLPTDHNEENSALKEMDEDDDIVEYDKAMIRCKESNDYDGKVAVLSNSFDDDDDDDDDEDEVIEYDIATTQRDADDYDTLVRHDKVAVSREPNDDDNDNNDGEDANHEKATE